MVGRFAPVALITFQDKFTLQLLAPAEIVQDVNDGVNVPNINTTPTVQGAVIAPVV